MVALTPLVDDRILQAVIDTRRRGFDVTVIVLEPAADADSSIPSTARGLWALERDTRRRTLEATGVRVAVLGEGDPVPLVVADLDRARARIGAVRR